MKRKTEAIWDEKHQYWRCRVQLNGVRKPFYSTDPSTKGKIEAEHKADVWLEEGAKKDLSFKELTTSYLAHLRTANGTAHKSRETATIRLYLSQWNKRKVSSLTNLDYQEAIDACVEGRKKPLSVRSCGHVRSTINALYLHARKANVKMQEPIGLTIPTGATKGQRKILQPDDIKKLFADDCYYANVFRFIVLTGLRPGEVCGLKRSDLKGNTLTIRRARNVQGETTSGKNENARRTLILPQPALDAIKPHKSTWLFPNTRGLQLDERALYSAWRRARERLEIEAVSLYELRHTMISICKSQVPLALLKQAVGHSANMDTYGTYGHAVDGDLQQTADLIAAAFNSIMG